MELLPEILDFFSNGILVVAQIGSRMRTIPNGTLIVSHGTMGEGLRYIKLKFKK
jgi:hypothetical protein